jgi:nitrite reductase (NADH) small subunit
MNDAALAKAGVVRGDPVARAVDPMESTHPLSTGTPGARGGREGPERSYREGPARPGNDTVSTGTRGARGERDGPECTNREGPVPPVPIIPVPQWVAVCRLNDIVPNTGVCALVGERQIAIFRLDDNSVYAIGNHDPFSRVNVLSRGIVGDLKGELVVASPVYKQHFSLASGQCIEDPGVRVPVFPVRLDGETVWVET